MRHRPDIMETGTAADYPPAPMLQHIRCIAYVTRIASALGNYTDKRHRRSHAAESGFPGMAQGPLAEGLDLGLIGGTRGRHHPV